MHKAPGVFALACVLAACASGPDYVAPGAELGTASRFTQAEAAIYIEAEAEVEFWQGFNDPLLATLVNDAFSANHDLRAAVARYERSSALYRHARFDRLPTVTASATAADMRASSAQLPGATREQRDANNYELRAEAAWEVDLFGRVRRAIEAQLALADASAAEVAAVQVALAGELVRSYFELRGLQAQLRVARDNADNQAGSLRYVDARLEAGRGIELDVVRARAQLEGTRARIPALEAEIAVAMHRIAVLTGREPGALIAILAEPAPMPSLPLQVPVGTPGDLLRRRPDIHMAERRLAAATARIGLAAADLFPRLTLGGLIGSQATDVGAFFERDSEIRVVALGIDWSFLDVGRVRARIAAADADAEAHLEDYQQAVLLALEETENAMVRFARAREEQAHLEQAAEASAAATRHARLRFDGGAADFLHVLDAERVQLEAENRLAVGRTRTATALVALYRSLAGGWAT